MNTKYIDLINQTFYFPQEEFKLEERNLQFLNQVEEVQKFQGNVIHVLDLLNEMIYFVQIVEQSRQVTHNR